MGQAGYEREADADEVAAMRAVVIEALAGGALGFSSDRSGFHRADGGFPVPSAVATQEELEALMLATRDAGRGIVHCAPGERFHWLYEFQPRLGRPITWSAIITYPRETKARAWWGDKIAYHLEHRARGADVHPQVTSRPVSFRISMREPSPFYMVPAFARVKAAAPDARAEVYADPEWRAEARAELDAGTYVDPRWDNFAVAETTTDPTTEGRAVAELAAERAQHPLDVVLDLAIADPEARFGVTFANDDLDGVSTLLTTEGCVLGLSDAGAHVSQFCDAPLPTDFLGRWVRDRDLMPVEAGVRRLTGELADLLGLADRGRLVPGAAADVVVVDWAALDPGPIRRVRDLPGGGDRLIADQPSGIAHILVNGVPITVDGHRAVAALDRLPGHVLDNGHNGGSQ
jgi:N-acyl-D-aspartate/D-glutamate deacylase